MKKNKTITELAHFLETEIGYSFRENVHFLVFKKNGRKIQIRINGYFDVKELQHE